MFDLGLRDWLLILGPLIIAGVLIHGYWRMRRATPKLKMALDKEFQSPIGDEADEVDDLSLFRAELPNGGARIVKRIVDEQDTLVSNAEADLNLDEDVPVLMEPVSVDEEDEASQLEFDALIPEEPLAGKKPGEAGRKNTQATTAKSVQAKPVVPKPVVPKPVVSKQVVSKPEIRKPAGGSSEKPEKLIIMNILGKSGLINGQHLVETLVTCGLQFGEMDIFHYNQEEGAKPIFSLVNAVEPGTFNLNTMDELQTPGVSVFIKLHDLEDPVSGFTQMIHVVKTLAEELDAEIKDATHNSVTQQTLDHEMQLVREYALKNG
jgi:cell division protein ZipA